MDKAVTRKGRRNKVGGVRNSTSDDSGSTGTELVNGKVKQEPVEDTPESNDNQASDTEESKSKDEVPNDNNKTNNAESSEFHGFDETPDPSGASVLNQLVGKFEADLEDEDSSVKESNEPTGDAPDEHKVLGQDIYTDSEDESPKQSKGTKPVKVGSKKRPLEKLAEEFNDDEKPTPPAKRARKKSAKAREAAGDNMENMKLLSEVSSEVTSSGDVPRKNKAIKEEPASEVTSSASHGRKSQDAGDSARRGRHATKDITDPIYLKPLDLGWKRELVYRGTNPKNGDGKRTGDIYYYTPDGKKVRSRVEILEHLRGTGLTVDNFCFLKEPLGLDDPAKEVIREASVRKASLDAAPTKRDKSPKVAKPKALKKVTDSPAVSDDTSNASATGSNGPSTSPPAPSGTKAGTPRVVLKTNKQSPKSSIKVKGTPGRKSNANAESPPTKGKVGRPRKDKENTQANDGSTETGVMPPNWDTTEHNEQSSINTASGLYKANTQHLPPVPRPPAPGPTPSEPPAPPQTVATIGGQKFIVVPKHNLLAVSPGATSSISPSADNTHHAAKVPSGVYFIPGSRGSSNYPGDLSGYSSNLLASKKVRLAETPDATVESTTATTQGKRNMENFISDLSNGYGALFHVMGYLKVQELLRASRVCRMWRDLSLHPNLWHTVRMKNSQVTDWDGFAAAISARGTRVLDLRKMLAPGSPEDIAHMWSEFNRVIGQADSLQRVELSRCPASVFEQLATSCPQLRVINAIAIKSEEVDLEPIRNVPLLEELRLKSNSGMSITATLDPLLSCRLKHLSLTSVRNLGSCNVEVISQLRNLESLELGDCVTISDDFGPKHLTKLSKLQRLRLENGKVPGCPVISIMESISQLPALRQLEIINFDVKPGFDKALGMCKQLRKLLIIPTYITTSASTNHIVLCSLPLLVDSLEYLVWGLTQELTRVTDLFMDQCEARKGVQGPGKLNAFAGECIPVVNPIQSPAKDKEKKSENGETEENKDSGEKMDVDDEKREEQEGEEKSQKETDNASNSDTDDVESLARDFRLMSSMEHLETSVVPPVKILPIPRLHKLLNQLLPNTRVKILKVPFTSTWRQTFPELSSF
ncbi:Bromodomain adjacent to zinc finger domain protein 2B [Frankliniella fusca]|uniref:Bromodomain adjacent to zinc finger domain protein 2B n=1 Tax=Frankliniella fusca TaxID=407009 RepID=A0AAE1H3J8_9NEOP|nr:Bromodomain adjacent to zinc finger domain protein 2B [Frankliniella fusca]